ncbi:zinc metalloproteinase nas-14-like isoform X2 [Schistocerca gregaria]|uniref:zinc metalloproteinase nas-14-like isoform X2 n=1 Tax=Schistocerca gregaria TaxID=7010 RepID=UPI00211E7AAD|nr:zinc metalloproteinase nas-14-like isoform X2 [Schistocerca gregaria]
MTSTLTSIMALVTASLMAAEIEPPEPVHKGLYFDLDVIKQSGADLSLWSPDNEENPWEASGLLEGDIMIAKVDDLRNVIRDEDKYWPNGVVPYYIDKDHFSEEETSRIRSALKEISDSTCVVIREFQKGDEDFVKIKGNATGCWSYIGRKRGGQVVNLQAPACLRKGTVIHEFLHVLGFHHQHSSHDRDSFIDIHWENIRPGHENNFKKYNETIVTDYGIGYDYDSVMHYSKRAFSKNREPTIVPKIFVDRTKMLPLVNGKGLVRRISRNLKRRTSVMKIFHILIQFHLVTLSAVIKI